MIRLLNITSKENKRFFVISGLGVSVGAFIVVFFLSLVAGIDRTVETKIFPEESIEVGAATSDVLDTVSLLSGGKGSSAEIGDTLGLSENTITFHRARIRKLLGLSSEWEMARFAILLHLAAVEEPNPRG